MATAAYNFRSYWHLKAAPEHVWHYLTAPKDWTKWWPGLKTVTIDEPAEEHVGQTIYLVFQALLGYRLSFTLTVTALRPTELIEFDATGDLAGTGRWQLSSPASDSSTITIDWKVRITKPWMVFLGPVLRPIFIISHTRLMAAGERGLQHYIREQFGRP